MISYNCIFLLLLTLLVPCFGNPINSGAHGPYAASVPASLII